MKNLVGNTPIIELPSDNEQVRLYAKCEFLSVTASIKDRVAEYIIAHARRTGALKPGQCIVEASSGNMGTALSAMGRHWGHPVHITCPEKTGSAKRKAIQALGAELTICPNVTDAEDPAYYVRQAERIAATQNGFWINQFDNPLNPACHFETTGREIVEFFEAEQKTLDVFITVGGSGGTITGCARRIKKHFPNAKVVMPDPAGSVYHDLFYQGRVIPENVFSYVVEGPGNAVMCRSMDLSVVDKIVRFTDQEAFEGCEALAKRFGLLVGHSAGANYNVAQRVMQNLPLASATNILILLPDSGSKYL